MLFAVTVGQLVDRVGARRPMLIATVVFIVATLTPWLWPHMAILYVASLTIGGSYMVFNVAFQHTVGGISAAADRIDNFRLAAVGYASSGIVGPLVAGALIERLSFELTYVALAVFPIATLIIVSRVRIPQTTAAQNDGKGLGTRGAIELMRVRPLRNLLFAGSLLDMAWDFFAFAIPVRGAEIGLKPSQIGAVLASFSVATLLIRILLPFITQPVRVWPLLMISTFATSGTFALFALSESALLMLVLAFVLGLCIGSTQPLILTEIHKSAPACRVGEVMGMRAAMIGFYQTGLPPVIGALGGVIGMGLVFGVMALLFAAGGGAAMRQWQRLSAERSLD